MNENVFSVRNLRVEYNGKVVLAVPKLDIPRGKLIFLLGNSGSGKTTFLETLGLMSYHFSDSSQIIFYPHAEREGIDYRTIQQNEQTASEIRREYFSFMFQETNLFPFFSVKENVAITQIIKNVPFETMEQRTKNKLRELQISELEKNHITEMSGGEKQRAAFVRAVCAEGIVFFADEPTGNLGDDDAVIVMKNIRRFIDDSYPHCTGIIVSHNISLALTFGDEIITIQDNHCIQEEKVLHSQRNDGIIHWHDLPTGDEKNSLMKLMRENYDAINHSSIPLVDGIRNESIISHHYNDKNFKRFFAPAITHDFSMKKKNVLVLIALIAFAFIAIGFAAGTLNVLKDKMQDPFVNWINIEVPYDNSEAVMKIKQDFSSDVMKRKYSVNSIMGYFRFPLNLYNREKRGTFPSYGMTMTQDDPLLNVLKNSDNLIQGDVFRGENDIGLIVTKEFLDLNGITMNDGFAFLSIGVEENQEASVPVPIRGLVKSLPGKSQFIATPYFYNKRYEDQSFNPTKTKELIIYCEEDESHTMSIKDSLQKFISSLENLKSFYPEIFISKLEPTQTSWKDGIVIKVSFLSPLYWTRIDTLYEKFLTSLHNVPRGIYHLYNFPNTPFVQKYGGDEFNRISVHIANLEQIEELRKIFLTYGLEIDMAKVESLKNYRFVVKLTDTLSVIIIVICIVSVCIFMAYILYIFLYKNRIYLGMLKAFGLPHITLKNLFTQKMISSLIKSIGIALVIAVFLGYTSLVRSLVSLWFPIDKTYLFFDLMNLNPIVFVFSLILFSYISLNLTANMILRKSPGDLIYDRM